jgi:hypothetical protein
MEKTSSNARRVWWGVFLLAILASFGPAWVRGGERATEVVKNGASVPPGAAAFALKEISAFDVPEPVWPHFNSGKYCPCGAEPNERVKRYPSFQSARPLYGSLVVGAQPGQRGSGLCYQFVVDESGGTGRGYDRLYFDTNRNGDLTDDGYKAPRRDIPKMDHFASPSLPANTCFGFLRIELRADDEPEHRLEVMPRLFVSQAAQSNVHVSFATTKAHQGLIQVGDEKFQAVLGHDYLAIAGWFDHPRTALHILPGDNPLRGRPAWRGGMQLSSMHRHGDTFYRFAATPTGDKLFVWPYQGPLGTLELGAGGRNVGDMSIAGSLSSRDASVSLSAELAVLPIKPVRSCRLPAGDYGPALLTVTYGQLNLMVLRNSHADGRPRGRAPGLNEVYPIKIRADRPFVLDFSSKPQVLFASPARDLRLRPGEELNVKAVLIDPALDIMFRSVRKGKRLDPKVAIKRANGSILAEGVMPFG